LGVPHLHPNGKFLYVPNRADFANNESGQPFFAGRATSFG
jgi:hypothetical protein